MVLVFFSHLCPLSMALSKSMEFFMASAPLGVRCSWSLVTRPGT